MAPNHLSTPRKIRPSEHDEAVFLHYKQHEVTDYELKWKIDLPPSFFMRFNHQHSSTRRSNSGIFPLSNRINKPFKWRAVADFRKFDQSIHMQIILVDAVKAGRFAVSVTTSIIKANDQHFARETEWLDQESSWPPGYYSRTIRLGGLFGENKLDSSDGSVMLYILIRTYGFAAKIGGIHSKEFNRRNVTISVGETNFRVDRGLLVESSPVFEMMLTHDCREKRDNRLVLEGFDALVVEMLLVYLISGGGLINNRLYERTANQGLRCDSLLQLLTAADMYLLDELKTRCEDALSAHREIDSICEILTIATRLSNERLIRSGISNMRGCQFYSSDSWKQFMDNNPRIALEVCGSLLSPDCDESLEMELSGVIFDIFESPQLSNSRQTPNVDSLE